MATYFGQIVSSFALISILVSGTSAVFWDDLRVTWGPGPAIGFFYQLPRLATDAVAQGWVDAGSTSCENQGRFSGYRYKLRNENEIAVLFDKNGVIAGVQVLFPQQEILNPNNTFRYDLVPMYQNETFNGVPYFVLTAYLVPPESICTTGRSLFDLMNEGTGTGLWFQDGASPNSRINVPLTRPEAAEVGWTNCECFPGMGLHNFFEVEKWAETDCNTIQPTQATFNLDGEMTGFVLQSNGRVSSTRFESPPNEALYAIIGVDRVPQCLIDNNNAAGTSTIHFYMVDEPWLLSCA